MMTPTFWQSLPRPLIGLAPMNGITDHPFRHIQKKYGGPMLLYTEFTSVERLCYGDRALLEDLLYDESQRPIIAQIFGQTPDLFRRMAVMLCELGFDGIDINMGCPTKGVVNRGSGAALIEKPDLARAIVKATKQGVEEWRNGATTRQDRGIPVPIVEQVEARHARLPLQYQARRTIPVSVKTRIGYAAAQVGDWIPQLLTSEPAAIALHGRTLRQGYAGLADWDQIAHAAEIAHKAQTIILGNGDIRSVEDAQQRIHAYGVDGVLIGRASYGNPFLFWKEGNQGPRPVDNRGMLPIALEHARLFEACISQGSRNRFMPMRKHLAWYVRNLPGANSLRRELILTSSAAEVETILNRWYAYRPRREN